MYICEVFLVLPPKKQDELFSEHQSKFSLKAVRRAELRQKVVTKKWLAVGVHYCDSSAVGISRLSPS
jgi:hypothetical protein